MFPVVRRGIQLIEGSPMAQDQFEDGSEQTARPGGGRIVTAGVVGACILGAGLGFWARPETHEQMMGGTQPAPIETPDPPGRRLQIVVDDTPAPIGALLEVLPAQRAQAAAAAIPVPPPPPSFVEP